MNFLDKWWLPITILLAAVLALTPIVMRVSAGDPMIVGGESYFNLRISEDLKSNPMLDVDTLQNRPYNFDLYHYFLALALFFIPKNGILITSLALSFLSLHFLYLSLRNMGLSEERSYLTLFVYLLSPIYVYAATTLSSATLTIFLITLTSFLYTKIKDKSLAILFGSLIILIHPTLFVLFILSLTVYSYYSKSEYRPIILMLISGVILAFIFSILFDYLPLFYLKGGLAFDNYITDFGAVYGYSFFALLFSLVSIILLWKKRTKVRVIGVLVILSLLLSTVSLSSRVLLNLMLAVYVAIAIEFFLKRKWAVQVLKELTLLILISSLLFSSVSFSNRVVDMEPSFETVATLTFLQQDKREGTVFAEKENGFVIQYFAKKKSYLDGMSHFYSDYEWKKAQAELIIKSKSPIETKKVLDNSNIKFFYIDPITKNRKKNEKGVLLVLDLSENFIRLGEFEEREAWLYIPI